MWAGDPRFTMCRCVSVEVGVTESGLGWAKWSTMKHVFCEEWDWIKRPTYHITSPQPLHITPPMHTIPYTPPSSRLQPVLGALDVQSIKGLSLNQSAFTNYLSIRPPSSVCALHPLSPSSEPLLYVFYNPPVHPNNKHRGQCDAKCFLAVIIGLVVEWMCVICVWMKGGPPSHFIPVLQRHIVSDLQRDYLCNIYMSSLIFFSQSCLPSVFAFCALRLHLSLSLCCSSSCTYVMLLNKGRPLHPDQGSGERVGRKEAKWGRKGRDEQNFN